MNNKGQALIEFILILPVVLILIFTTIDIFNYLIQKNDLETEVFDKVKLVSTKEIPLEDLGNYFDKDYKVVTFIKDDYQEVEVTKKHVWISPITELVISNTDITIKRVIPFE